MNRRPLCCALVVLVALAAPLVHAQPTVFVQGEGNCPSADMIRAALAAERPAGDLAGQTLIVEVTQDRLFLSLGEGQVVRREIPADRDCSVRAQSIAVIVAAWSGGLASSPTASPVFSDPAGAPVPPSAAAVSVASPNVEPAVLSPAASASPGPDPAAVSVAAVPAPVRTLANPGSHVIELDGGAFYSPLWGHTAGAWLGMGRTPRGGGFGGRVLAAYQAARDVALEGGTNQVLRLLAGLALTYHLQRELLFAAGDVGLVGTYTRAHGTGYEPSATAATTNLGGLADLRGGVRLGRARLWLNARMLRMVHAETVKVESTSPGVADRAELAAWDLQLGAGLGFRWE